MEDAKSGHLEATFGGNYRQIKISHIYLIVVTNNALDLSLLSVGRQRL